MSSGDWMMRPAMSIICVRRLNKPVSSGWKKRWFSRWSNNWTSMSLVVYYIIYVYYIICIYIYIYTPYSCLRISMFYTTELEKVVNGWYRYVVHIMYAVSQSHGCFARHGRKQLLFVWAKNTPDLPLHWASRRDSAWQSPTPCGEPLVWNPVVVRNVSGVEQTFIGLYRYGDAQLYLQNSCKYSDMPNMSINKSAPSVRFRTQQTTAEMFKPQRRFQVRMA